MSLLSPRSPCWSALAFLVTAGCVSQPPTRPPPEYTSDRPSIRFEYQTAYPISVGEVRTFDGECKEDFDNAQILFRRGQGNFLVSDINMLGTWLEAAKPVNLFARAITSASAYCTAAATMTPLAGKFYLLRLTQASQWDQGPQCTLELLEGPFGSQTASADLQALPCNRKGL